MVPTGNKATSFVGQPYHKNNSSTSSSSSVNAGDDTYVAFKNCAPFSTYKTEISDTFVDEANHTYIAMPMYNWIEYSDNYLDTSESLWQFKKDEFSANDIDLIITNSQSFKYKADFLGKTSDVNKGNSFVKNAKIVLPLKIFEQFSEIVRNTINEMQSLS